MTDGSHYRRSEGQYGEPVRPRAPVSAGLLEYEAVARAPSMSKGKQFAIGIATTYAWGGITGTVGALAPALIAPWLVAVCFVVFGVLVLAVPRKTRWTAFLPGALTAIFLVPIVAAVTCCIAFATGNAHISH